MHIYGYLNTVMYRYNGGRMLPPGESRYVSQWDRQTDRRTDARPLQYAFR